MPPTLWALLTIPGITIFDISEPSNVRYCFVDFMGMESDRVRLSLQDYSSATD